jgi:hypothetical protein
VEEIEPIRLRPEDAQFIDLERQCREVADLHMADFIRRLCVPAEFL